MDDFYAKKETEENFKKYRNNLLKVILSNLQKYTKRLSNMEMKLQECKNKDMYRIYGELLTTNLYQLKNNTDQVTLFNYYDNTEITIPLDKRFSPANNAKRFFKKYNKLKNTIEIVGKQKQETKQELDYLESLIYELERAQTIEELDAIYTEISENVLFEDKFKSVLQEKKKNKKRKMNFSRKELEALQTPLTFSIHGYTVLVGKNNKQNDYLTLKIAKKSDLWFHTQKIHGSHVILKLEGKEVPDDTTLIACAEIAAFYSKGKNSSNVPVDYTYLKNVKKPSGSKPGMVVYVNYKTLFVNPKDPNKR